MEKIAAKIREHPLLIGRPTLRQFIKFGLVGASNTVLDFGVYLALTRWLDLHYLIANLIAFSLAASSSFILNKYWTFRDNRLDGLTFQYIKFLIVSTVGAFLTEFTLFALVHFAGIHDIIGKVTAIAVVTFWNFFANKHWTFRRRPDPPAIAVDQKN